MFYIGHFIIQIRTEIVSQVCTYLWISTVMTQLYHSYTFLHSLNKMPHWGLFLLHAPRGRAKLTQTVQRTVVQWLVVAGFFFSFLFIEFQCKVSCPADCKIPDFSRWYRILLRWYWNRHVINHVISIDSFPGSRTEVFIDFICLVCIIIEQSNISIW